MMRQGALLPPLRQVNYNDLCFYIEISFNQFILEIIKMGLLVLRCIFVFVAAGLGVSLIRSGLIPQEAGWMAWATFGGVVSVALGVIALDLAIRKKHLDAITAIYFGMIVGLFMTYILGLALIPLPIPQDLCAPS